MVIYEYLYVYIYIYIYIDTAMTVVPIGNPKARTPLHIIRTSRDKPWSGCRILILMPALVASLNREAENVERAQKRSCNHYRIILDNPVNANDDTSG